MKAFSRIFLGAAAALCWGCLEPVVEPENVYDASEILKNENLKVFDRIQVSYLDANEPGRRIVHWSGIPGDERIPLLTAEEGEVLVLELRGWKEPKGLCFTARYHDDGRSFVEKDECGG